jgi:hypothetical protein
MAACLTLCVAGALKLRSPQSAAGALALPPWIVRVLAAAELALGAACAVHPTRAGAVAVGLVYSLFAIVAVILQRRRVACGCFGDNGLPVSRAHVIASELLAAMAVAAAFSTPRGLGWVGSQPGFSGVAMVVGLVGATYAMVLLYVEVPRAWRAWSGQ